MKRKPKGQVRPAAPTAETPSEGSGAGGDEKHDSPTDAAPRVEQPTRRQLRLQQVDGVAVAADVDRPARELKKEPLPGGRRDRRLQYTASMTAVQGTGTVPARMPETAARADPGMTIEDALAEREALDAAAKSHVDDVVAQGSDDPFAVDPVVLARQQALAQRAAALNARVRQAQEQSVRTVQVSDSPQDPVSPCNLSFLTPLQVMRVAGSNQVVLRGPATSLIPVVIPSAALPGATEAMSKPIGARSAFGLDPLDAMTAGLRRLRRVRYLQYSMLGVGAAALATGIIMTVSSLNG